MIKTVLVGLGSGLLVIGAFVVFAAEKPAEASPMPAKAKQPKLITQERSGVTKLYNDTCSNCHGVNGQGGGAGTRTLNTVEKFEQTNDRPFFDAIKKGVPDMGMEAYGETMTDAQIWGLVVHIREMQKRALRAAEPPSPADGIYKSKHANYKVETVVDRDQGLNTPWAIDWLPTGKALITNRSGTLVIAQGGKVTGTVEGIPASVENGQGGLLDVAVHPDYAKNGWIYLSFSDPVKGGTGRSSMTKVVRGKLSVANGKTTWTSQETIFEANQDTYNGSGVHYGSRIVFDGKGHVFFSIGERGNGEMAQDLSRPNGKVYRVNEDGTIPTDNPFLDKPSAIKAVWSYGHRNPQGLAFDLKGELWDTEHAPRGGDEVNRIQKGSNYGWPRISFGINYSDAPFAVPWSPGGEYAMPVYRWLPSTGACGLDTMRGNAFPGWKGDLVAGGLAGQNVERLRVDGDKLIEHEELLFGKGRVRDVACGPDGFLYVVLNDPHIVIRLVPVK